MAPTAGSIEPLKTQSHTTKGITKQVYSCPAAASGYGRVGSSKLFYHTIKVYIVVHYNNNTFHPILYIPPSNICDSSLLSGGTIRNTIRELQHFQLLPIICRC
jgi:hypothetical protein